MVSISPVPKTPVPVLYFHTDRSTPLPAGPSNESVHTFVQPGPPGRPGPPESPAGEAAAAGDRAATTATTTAAVPTRPRRSPSIATTSYGMPRLLSICLLLPYAFRTAKSIGRVPAVHCSLVLATWMLLCRFR